MQKNVLTRLQEHQLFSELEKMKGEIEGEKMSASMLNRAISPRLTFPVTDSNIKGACKVLEINLFRRPSPSGSKKYKALKEDMENMKKEIELLKQEVEELKKRKWQMQDGRAVAIK